MSTTINVALIGNPNCGKTSVFNLLTGLNQKVGNFPGVTVDKKVGKFSIDKETQVKIIDLPGTYSLYPKSMDEQIVLDYLNDTKKDSYPDVIIAVVDTSNLKRNLLLITQLIDIKIPLIIALNMVDLADQSDVVLDHVTLSKELDAPIIAINGRNGTGLQLLKTLLKSPVKISSKNFIDTNEYVPIKSAIKKVLQIDNDYWAMLMAHHYRKHLPSLSNENKQIIAGITQKEAFSSVVAQINETTERYQSIATILQKCLKDKNSIAKQNPLQYNIDKILIHPFWGYGIFLLILFLIFQAIFSFAALPMEWIDTGISNFSGFLQNHLPASKLTDLLTEGLLAGIGGVLIFVPQIALLFLFIALLEESGYMSRVMFIMDKLMSKFGMSGRSVVPLISGAACAVPAIMATRSIENYKTRMITIFVTPLISCSARIPVFTILIALIIPSKLVLGFMNLQGLVLMGLYLLGFVAAMVTGWAMKMLIKSKQRNYFIMELPTLKMPLFKNVVYTIFEKVKTFVFEAGKIILAISIILWVLASYGPNNAMENARIDAENIAHDKNMDASQTDKYTASKMLEASYAGHFGKYIEPAIAPMGFDWKIGIALITSFAAREVFIGTMATIYSVGSNSDEATVKQKMAAEINPKTGRPMYSFALGCSLLIFYVFAMQCMSTLAVVYRETKSWTWPAAQLVYMTGLAYLCSFIVYQLLS
jgi:ferrous iron transport protein B